MSISELNDFNLGITQGKYYQQIGLSFDDAIANTTKYFVKLGIEAVYHPDAVTTLMQDCKVSTLSELQSLQNSLSRLSDSANVPGVHGSALFNTVLRSRAKHLGYSIIPQGLKHGDSVIKCTPEQLFKRLYMSFIAPKDRLTPNASWFQLVQDDTLKFFTAAVTVPEYSIKLILQGRAKDKEDFFHIQTAIPHVETSRNITYYPTNLQTQEVYDWGTEPDQQAVQEWIAKYQKLGYQ